MKLNQVMAFIDQVMNLKLLGNEFSDQNIFLMVPRKWFHYSEMFETCHVGTSSSAPRPSSVPEISSWPLSRLRDLPRHFLLLHLWLLPLHHRWLLLLLLTMRLLPLRPEFIRMFWSRHVHLMLNIPSKIFSPSQNEKVQMSWTPIDRHELYGMHFS